MTRWQFIADTNGDQIELTAATQRKVTWRLDAASDASFSIDGRHAQAGEIDELVTDLIVLIDGARWYRGRVGPTNDDVTTEQHAVGVATADYRALLSRRILYEDDVRSYVGVDQFALAWSLIDQTQTKAGGDLGIVEGVGVSSGVLRDRTYPPGQNVGEALNQLGAVINGFDWEIDGDLHLNRWYPERGVDQGVVLDLGGLVQSMRRTVDPSSYFTALRLTGDNVLGAEIRDAGLGVELLTANQQSLESGTTGWSAQANVTVAQSSLYALDGTYSLELSAVAAGDSTVTTGADSPNVSPGDRVQFVGRVRAPNGAQSAGTLRQVYAFLLFRSGASGGGSTVLTVLGPTVTEEEGAWRTFSVEGVAPADALSVRLNVRIVSNGAAGEKHYVDDMTARPSTLAARWDAQVGEPSILLQSTLSERADVMIEDGPLLLPSYVVTLRQGRWEGPSHIWLGDTVRLVARSRPRFDVDVLLRVREIVATLDDNDLATVELVLGAPRPDFARRIPELSRRLTDLERR